jgi:hypothetical protein
MRVPQTGYRHALPRYSGIVKGMPGPLLPELTQAEGAIGAFIEICSQPGRFPTGALLRRAVGALRTRHKYFPGVESYMAHLGTHQFADSQPMPPTHQNRARGTQPLAIIVDGFWAA